MFLLLMTVQAWKASSGEAWEVQPAVYHSHSIRSLQFVYSGTRAKPITSTPAPVSSGVINEALYDGSGDSHHHGTGTSALGLPMAGAGSSTGVGGSGGSAPVAPALPEVLAKEGPVSVHGVTPVHTYSRLISLAADGRMAVFDVYTGAPLSCRSRVLSQRPPYRGVIRVCVCARVCPAAFGGLALLAGRVVYEDSTSVSVGSLRAAHISKDGSRVCLASAHPGSQNPVFVAPAASLERAVVCPLLVREMAPACTVI
jgi:hypothetical protein